MQDHIARLNRVQRLGAQAVIGAFRTVSTAVLQDEAGLEPVESSLEDGQAHAGLTSAPTDASSLDDHEQYARKVGQTQEPLSSRHGPSTTTPPRG